MQQIRATVPCLAPPRWAVLERALFDLLREVPDVLLARYTRPDGSLLWPPYPDHSGVDGLDDAYESFANWPVFYLLGGDDRYLVRGLEEMEAVTGQFSKYPTGFGPMMVMDGYESSYDWFHQSEGYRFFYGLCAADPQNATLQQQARHYSRYYTEPTILADPIYDPGKRLLRCPYVGSAGPGFAEFATSWYHDLPLVYGDPWPRVLASWMSYLGLPFQDIPGIRTTEDLADPANADRMVTVARERMGRGDTVMNLASTSLMFNAYVMTGDTRCRDWVLSYTDAWRQRWQASGSPLIPDNVGLSGQVGEYTKGKWYGGWYGWTFPHGWHSVGDGVTVSAEAATMLTGDTEYAEMLRTCLDVMAAEGIERDGTLYVPGSYGDEGWYGYKTGADTLCETDGTLLWRGGWFGFMPGDPLFPTHLWALTLRPDDKARVRQLRNQARHDFDQVPMDIPPSGGKDLGGHEQAWIAYLDGEFPTYPERILEHNLALARTRLQAVLDDTEPPTQYLDPYLQLRSPVVTEGLTQLTLGAPRPVHNGGSLVGPLRYWDADRRRPGLPPGVAALVSEVTTEGVTVQLVNLDPHRPRRVVLSAGTSGEHTFGRVDYTQRVAGWQVGSRFESVPSEQATRQIDAAAFEAELLPQAEIVLRCAMTRYRHQPRYQPPWTWDHVD